MSEPTPIDLPVGLRWVKLVCRLGTLVSDSAADADPHPDLLPVGGTLTLHASPSRVRIQEDDGRWRSVEVAGRTYTIRADGELVDSEGRVGVWIPDPASLLVEPQGYAVTAVVKPTGGTDWRVTFGGSAVLPDVVDLVAVSSVGSVSPSVTASVDARLYALETGGGVDVSQVVEDYLTANPPAAAPDATTAAKGLVRLAGDLAGTADAPTVPGLADKADAGHDHAIGDVTGLQTALDGKQPAGSYAPADHNHVVGDLDATGTPSATTYLRGDGAWATPEGGGDGSQGPSHESILASGNVTLPTEHPVLTIRADDPATLSILEAPDGTVVTIHVAHGWENLTWGPGITVTGDSATTETWVVLVRAEGKWQALVSGESGGGSGILTGDGNPNTLGIEATVGVLYADEAQTDGATLWSADGMNEDTGATEWVVVKGQAEKYLPNDTAELYLSRLGPRLLAEVTVYLTESGNGEEVTLPASTIDLGEVDEGFRGSPAVHVLALITPPDNEWYSSPVQLPPIVCVFTQLDRYVLHIPEVVIPAYTSPDPVVVMGNTELVAAGSWPKGGGGWG